MLGHDYKFLEAGEYWPELLRRGQILVKLRGLSPIWTARDRDAPWVLVSRRFRADLAVVRSTAYANAQVQAVKNRLSGGVFVQRKVRSGELEEKGFVRNVPNSDVLARAVQDLLGAKLIDCDPASESPETVVRKFASSSLLIGQYGAGLVHSIWMPPGAKVIEITASEANPFTPWLYNAIAVATGQKFISARLQHRWDSPIDLAALNQVLEAQFVASDKRTQICRLSLAAFVLRWIHRPLRSFGLR
jgi:capsular polysaccharide biosynthesis protein